MIKCRSPRSIVFGMSNLLWLVVRSEYVVSGRSDKNVWRTCDVLLNMVRNSASSASWNITVPLRQEWLQRPWPGKPGHSRRDAWLVCLEPSSLSSSFSSFLLIVAVVVIRYELHCVMWPCRMLYWTDWSRTIPGIYRSSVVNPAREMLVNGNLVWPNALAIDFTGS